MTTAAPKPVCLSTLLQDQNKQRMCDILRPLVLSPVLRRSQTHKPVEDLSIEQTRDEEIDDECTNQINVSTVSLDTSSSHNSVLDPESISLNPQASLFTPAVRSPDYSAPFMENPSLQCSVESSEDNEIGTMYMNNSEEDVCSSAYHQVLSSCGIKTYTYTRTGIQTYTYIVLILVYNAR